MNILRQATTLLAVGLAVTSCAGNPEGRHLGVAQELGYGAVQTYADLDAEGTPTAIGVTFTAAMLDGLPTMLNPMSPCFDVDGDGTVDPATECMGDWELAFTLPDVLADRQDIPIQWVGLNWHPRGHMPPGVYDIPHFDFHFYLADHVTIRQIGTGTCGILIDCEAYERAMAALPEQYAPEDYINVGAATPSMGNHLLNSTSPELTHPPQLFTHTFIYGSYDGHITFYEPMITHEFFKARPNECFPVKQPQAWEVAGYHPTQYCIRFEESNAVYTVSLEGFTHREAM